MLIKSKHQLCVGIDLESVPSRMSRSNLKGLRFSPHPPPPRPNPSGLWPLSHILRCEISRDDTVCIPICLSVSLQLVFNNTPFHLSGMSRFLSQTKFTWENRLSRCVDERLGGEARGVCLASQVGILGHEGPALLVARLWGSGFYLEPKSPSPLRLDCIWNASKTFL